MYYFVSDTHFGMDGTLRTHDRERLFVRWLDQVSADAKEIFIVGDLFDFWYEFRNVVPKGHTRVLGKIAELTDRGIKVHFFTGNHDMWVWDYLQKECGMSIHRHGEVFSLYDKKVFIAHGDNMYIRKPFWEGMMQRAFRSRFLRWLFRTLVHPDWVVAMGRYWSDKSRKSHVKTHVFCGEKEYLVQFARQYQKCLNTVTVDYFVFGHIHCAHKYELEAGVTHTVFLGEWLYRPAYAVMHPDGHMELRQYS